MRLMGIEELQQARDEAALNAMQAYFDVVYYTESVRLAREQRQTSAANLRKSRKLYELGLKSAADVAEIESQCASDDFLLTQQENNLALAKISLCEAMNYPSGSCPEIVAEIAVGTPAGAAAYGEVLAYALEKHPKAQQAAYNVQQMRLKYSVAKGKYYPSVSVGGGYSTNFFMSLDDRSLYAPFGSQLRDNRGYYFSARLSIPIFGGLTKRTSVNRHATTGRIAELQRDATLRTLQSEVAQAYQQMLGAGKEFVQASKKAEAARLAYEAVAGKYERGMVSALDLQTASDKLLQARRRTDSHPPAIHHQNPIGEYYNGEPVDPLTHKRLQWIFRSNEKKDFASCSPNGVSPIGAVCSSCSSPHGCCCCDNASTLRVDAGTLSVAEVTQGDFNDYIRVTGQVEPITTVQLSPLEAGVVERLVVEEGASVRGADVLVELSNPSLTLEILNSEAELAEKQNLLRNTLISMEQEKLTLRQNKAQLDLDVARKRRAFEQNDELYAHRLIAREEWLQAKEDWELAEKQRELNIERQIQDSLYRTVQVEQMEDNLANMRRNMQLIRQRIGNLAVKSPIDGEIGLLDVVLGQSVASGQKIGQVNDLSDFKVEAQIDEIYIDRVRTGLEASFERQDSNYRMRLRKVYPEVRNNVFRADFNFTGSLSGQYPQRADLLPASATGTTHRSGSRPARHLLPNHGRRMDLRPPRPKATAPTSGRSASARQNPQYYEVLEGLQPASGSSSRATSPTAPTTYCC